MTRILADGARFDGGVLKESTEAGSMSRRV
jgi:hypothetical protein